MAIKILAPECEQDERFAERFRREAKTLARMNHPNIVTVFDYGETDGLFYIVMEYVDGVNLRDLLREGKMDPEQALAIVPPGVRGAGVRPRARAWSIATSSRRMFCWTATGA